MRQTRSYLLSITAAAGIAVSLLSIPAWAVPFMPTNLVTDDPSAHAAQITDPGLKNAWGRFVRPNRPILGFLNRGRNIAAVA
jgi:hypothetical protein